jgi:predicted Zn-dependent peptidase
MYFVTVPANKLELWFWMESDRLLDPVFREFYVEREVVREERRTRVEADPTELMEEQFNSIFWSSLAYRHPTAGWPSDIVAIRRDQARRFFTTYYAPNNITAVLVGDFDATRAISLAETYLGRIPRRSSPLSPVVTDEIKQIAERRIRADTDTNPSVQIRWHAVPFVHTDLPVFDLVSDLLDGRTGRLFESLVEKKRVAVGEPWAWVQPLRYSGSFEIGAEVAEGRTHEEVEAALLAEIERLKRDPVPERELLMVKNQNRANRFRDLRSNRQLLYQLLSSEGLGGWRYLNQSPVRIRDVSPQRIAEVARNYFPASGKNVMWYFRRESTDLGASPGGAEQ